MKHLFRHITLVAALGLTVGGNAFVYAQSDVKSDVYVLDPSKAFKAQLVATSGMTGDVVITMPSLSGTMLLTGTAGAQGGMDRSTYLFNVQYTAGTGNALGAILTSTTPTTNASANGLDILATADGTGTATALKLRATGSTADNYALEIAAGGIKISATLPTAVSSSQPLVLEGGVVKIGSVGTLTGSGTANTIPVWTGGTALGNSMLSQNGAGTVFTVGGRQAITATTNQLVLGSTNTTTISATAPAASLTYTISDVGADAEFVMTEGAQTVNGVKTFGSAPNLSSLTARGVLTLDASKNVVSTALTDGQILIGSTGATPAAATLTAGSGITITNGAGTITVAAMNPMPAGTTNNATLRYNLATTAWVENTSVLATSAGALTAVRATLQGTTNQLVLGVTNTTTITSPAPVAARTYTIPDAGANTEFVMAAGNQSIGGTKTFTSAVNLSSQSANAILTTDASKNVASTTLANGQLLIGSTGAAPAAAALTAGSGITITNGAGSITIAATNPMPAGTTNNATLRYNSGTSAWVENTSVTATSAGVVSAASMALTNTSNQLVLGTTNTTTISASAPSASRVYTIADPGASASFVMTEGAQTINGNKTISGTTNLSALTASLPLKLDGSKNITAAAIDLASATEVTGALPINRGGTNSATALGNNRIMVSSGGAIVEAAALTNGQLLIGSTGAAPVAAALTAGSGITITPAAGSITIAATNPMPAGTTTNATLRYSGTAWVENTNVLSASGGALTLAATTNQLILGAVAGPNVTITAPAPAASRTYTIPDAGGAASFVMTAGAQTIAGVKTFSSAPNLSSLSASLPLKLDGSKNITAAAIDLTSATEVTGALPINRGGTNSATALGNNRIMVSSGGAIVEAAALTNGQLLIGSTGAAPVAATLTAGSGITITPAAGSITIAATNPMPAGTTTDATLRYSGTAWVENTSVKATATGAVSAATLALSATSNQMVLGTTNTATISASAPSASRVYTIADPGANASFVMTEGAQTINGNKTISGTTNLSALTASLPLKLDGSKNITAAGINLASATEVLNTLPINRGGTNSTTTLNNNRIMVSSGGAIVEAAALTNGQLLIGSTGAAPVAATLTAGSGITITNGAGTISIASSGWSLTGNAGLTDNTNNYLGTTDAQPVYFITGTGGPNKRMTIGATGLIGMNTTPLASYTLAIQGNMKMVDATTSTISANKELIMEQTGDTYGTSRLRLQHRNGSNGALFETATGSVDLVDFGFKPGAGVQSNIRLEARTGSMINAASNTTGEFQFLMASTTTPVYALTLGQGSATFNAGVVGIGDPTPDDKFTVGATSQFRVSASGDITRIRDIAYTWPSAHAAGILTNNGSGTLSWTPGSVVPSGTSTDQTLRWNGTAWVANSTVTASSVGVLTATSAALTAATNQVVLGTTNTVTINAAAPVASRVYTIPAMSNAAAFIMTEGAGFTSYATGDILYASSSNTLSRLAIGADGRYLTSSGGVPIWSAGSLMQYDVTSAQSTSTTASNFLFNVQYGTITGAATGARIASVTTASNSGATGLAITAIGTGTSTATALSLSATGSSTKYALTVADGSGFSGFGTTAPTHVVHVVNTATTDEVAAVLGNASGSTSNQAIGVWGDASSSGASAAGTIGVLATGSGNTTAAQTNIALQVADGNFTMGRTTETGTGYTVVEGATAGTTYTAEGPSGVIEVNLGTVGGWIDNANTSTDRMKMTSITLNNRYITTNSIVFFTVIDKVNNSGGDDPDPEEGMFSVNGDGRATGSIVMSIGYTLANGVGTGAWDNGDKIRIGYMIVNPSK
ncbi:MAG: hypothetical protein JSS89_03395 [Bacteroidetes bacterium]|nr:hypothetical protein [Bacteroidota bacterium]